MISRGNDWNSPYFTLSRQYWGHPRYVAQHILHMNKLPIYFLPIIVPISVEFEFQDVTCSNTNHFQALHCKKLGGFCKESFTYKKVVHVIIFFIAFRKTKTTLWLFFPQLWNSLLERVIILFLFFCPIIWLLYGCIFHSSCTHPWRN